MEEELVRISADSLSGNIVPADSAMQAVTSDTLAQGDFHLSAVSAADVFGPGSYVDAAVSGGGYLPATADSPLFQSLVLLLAAAYVLFVYDHLGDMRALFGKVTRSERLRESRGGHTRFFVSALVIGILLGAAFGVRLLFPAENPFQTVFPVAGPPFLLLGAGALFCGVILFQYGVLQAAGRLTLSMDVADGIIHLKTLAFTAMAVFGTPFALLFVFTPPGTGGVWSISLAVGAILLMAVFLRETFVLFLSKKISILHWFLYLCTVEVFPVSFLWLIVTRSHAS